MNGSNEKILAERSFPEGMFTSGLAWSPDGSAVLCGEFRGGMEACALVRINIDDGKERIINTQKWRFIDNIVWSSEARDIIINASYQSFDKQIWGVSFPDGELRRITNDLNNYRGLSLTMDGSSLITVQSEVRSTIWILPGGETQHARQITTGKYDGTSGIEWTPDGKIIYGSKDMKLWIINSDGSHPRRLSSDEHNDLLPSVSKNGQSIVFTSQPVSAFELWKMDIDGSHRTKLADYAGDPQITPDGKWVIYTSAHEGPFTLWKLSIDGSNPTPLLDMPAMGATISPDGKQIVCYMGDDNEPDKLKIAVFPFKGGEPGYVFDIPNGFDMNSCLRWTPDGLAITYIVSQGGISNIWEQPLDGKASKQLTNFKEKLIFAFDWSKNGTLACSRGTIDNDVVLIKDLK